MIKSWNHYLIVGFTEGGSGSGASLLSLFGQALVVAGGLNIPPWKEDIFLYFHENFQKISIFELTFDATIDNGSHEKNTQYDEKGNPCGLEKIEAFFSREVVGVVDDDWLDDLKNWKKFVTLKSKFHENCTNSYLVFFSVICHCLMLLVGDLVGILVNSKKNQTLDFCSISYGKRLLLTSRIP